MVTDARVRPCGRPSLSELCLSLLGLTRAQVDGFKSYAQRTVVPAFDPFFNAITGLNGSGKSNILDSICFVLGITNLSQARRRPPAATPDAR